MATSKMKIKKVCEWCGTTFYAQKLTTRFGSHRCNNLAYKEAVRQNVKLMSEFQDAWKRDFTKMSSMIEITAICYADNTDYGPKLINSWTAIDRPRRIKKEIILEKSITDNEQYVMTDTTTIDKENIEEEWSMYHDDQYKIIDGKTIIYDSIIIQ